MEPRVLLIDDQPDVVAAVKRHLDGFDVRTTGTLDKAMDELRSGSYQVVLCDGALGDPARLAGLLGSDHHFTGLIIDRGVRSGRDYEQLVVYQPESGAQVELSSLRFLLDGPEPADGQRPLAGDLFRRLVAIFAEKPRPAHATDVLRVFARHLGARYVACLVREDAGARVLCEFCAGGLAAPAPPAGLLDFDANASMRLLEANSLVWVCAAHADEMLVAAFTRPRREALAAFAECAAPAAAFVRRSASAPASVESASIVLGALGSITRDTRNLLTGMALCLSALKERRRAGHRGACDEIAVIDRQLSSLVALAREYSRIDSAFRLCDTVCRADAMLAAFAALMAGLGIEVESLETAPSACLSDLARGVAARTLMHVGLELVELRASKVRLRSSCRDGRQLLEISFVPGRPWMANAIDAPLAEACELANSRGGRAWVQTARGRTKVSMEFAQPEPNLAQALS